MTRPTKEQVDTALRTAEQVERFGDFTLVNILAAEVRALREETNLLGEQLQMSAAYVVKLRAEIEELNAKLKRAADWALGL